jgi:alpha-1,2-mannosyltransferase
VAVRTYQSLPEIPSRPEPMEGSPAARVGPGTLWVVGGASAATIAVYFAWFAHLAQMDFQVYRLGGQHVVGADLYSVDVTVLGRHLLFTYPPLAALLFWPFAHLSVFAGQMTWNAVDLVALTALLAVSVAAARARPPVRTDWRAALMLLAPIGFLLYPVRSDLLLGQINIILTLMIVADLTMDISWRGRHLPRGVLVGVAAAIKLTPLVFIAYLIVSRQWRNARNATLSCLGATGVLFAVNPRASWLYFTKDAFDLRRIGDSEVVGNQTLHAAINRAHLAPSSTLVDLLSAVVLVLGIGLATMAYRRSSPLLAVLVCAATGLLISPVSWTHHYVWIVPGLLWLVAGVDRPARGEWWAIAAALPFVVLLPSLPGGSGVLWYLRADAYVVMTLGFLVFVAVLLIVREHRAAPASLRVEEDALRLPAPTGVAVEEAPGGYPRLSSDTGFSPRRSPSAPSAPSARKTQMRCRNIWFDRP